jgi:mycothiol synthase
MNDRYTTRTYRGSIDLPAMVELRNARMEAEGHEDFTTVEGIAQQYEHLQRCDPERDILLVEDGDRLVGYARTTWDEVADGYRGYYLVAVSDPDHPELEQALYDWVEARAEIIAAGHPSGDKRLLAWTDEETSTASLLQSRGYVAQSYGAIMVRSHLDDIPSRQLPEGVEIRPVHETHLRAIWEADVEAFRDHRGFIEPTETDWEAWLDAPHWDPSLWQVAWSGDQVVGQVLTFIDRKENDRWERKRGWTEYISTAREWRRKGIAAALICASLIQLRERGMTEAALGVDVENLSGALRLYESLGYVRTRLEAEYARPVGDDRRH